MKELSTMEIVALVFGLSFLVFAVVLLARILLPLPYSGKIVSVEFGYTYTLFKVRTPRGLRNQVVMGYYFQRIKEGKFIKIWPSGDITPLISQFETRTETLPDGTKKSVTEIVEYYSVQRFELLEETK